MENLHDQMLEATRKVSHAKTVLARGQTGLGKALMTEAIKNRTELRKKVEAENAKVAEQKPE